VPSANKTDGTMESRLAVEDIECECTVVVVVDDDDDDDGQAWKSSLSRRHGDDDTATNFDEIRDVGCSSGGATKNADVVGGRRAAASNVNVGDTGSSTILSVSFSPSTGFSSEDVLSAGKRKLPPRPPKLPNSL
jgi:hypothetical protein